MGARQRYSTVQANFASFHLTVFAGGEGPGLCDGARRQLQAPESWRLTT